MKKIFSNKEIDVLEINNNKKDIVKVSIVKKAAIKNKTTGETYFNGNFMIIKNRKGNTRVIDLEQEIDITSILKKFELVYKDNTKEEVLFSSDILDK